MKERAVAWIAFLVLAGGAAGLFLVTHERVDVDVFVPARGEAQRNPLLAAQTLLFELGYRATSGKDFAPLRALPDTSDTLVLMHGYAELDYTALERVLAWVEDGGHLVLSIEHEWGGSFDPVFTPLNITGVYRWSYDSVTDTDAHDDALSDADPGGSRDGTTASVADGLEATSAVTADAAAEPWPSDQATLEGRRHYGAVPYDNGLSIDFGDNDMIWTIVDEFGDFAGQIGYGAGAMTVAADLGIAVNTRLGEGDNAYILTRLLGPADLAGQVWLYYGTSMPSLWALLWERAAFLIKASAALLLLFLWYAAQRFGPLIPAPPVARKAFMEHIAASGRFLWRSHRHDVLLGNAQQEFLRDYQRRHPAGRALTGDERLRHVARVCDMPAETVHNALRDPDDRSHSDFVSALGHLQTMWKRL